MKLRGKMAVASGSGAGIGQSIVKRFSREGASVVLTDVNAASSAAAAEAIRGGGGECFFMRGDVS